MEALRSHPPGTTSRRRHDHKRSPEYRRQDIQTKHRKRSLQTSARHLAETSLPIGDLGDGPVPRSKEKNDEFIQCWLQQTQPRPSHIPEPDRESGRPRLAEQSRSRAHADKHRKRPRSPSEHPRPSLNAAGQVEEYRFEKRARHKTRDDKYDYKARAGNKRASGEELRKRRTKNASGRSDEVGEDRYSTHQEGTGAAVSHMLRRASKAVPKASRVSQNLTRRVSEPRASKSRLNKSQKEDKELEELSAFFSRRRSHQKAGAEGHDLADHGSHLRGPAVDIETHIRPNRHRRRCSSHGSQESYKSTTIGGAEGTSRVSRSLSAIGSRDSKPAPLNRPSSKPKSCSAWSQQYDGQAAEGEFGSYYSGRARSRRSTTEFVTDTLEPQWGRGPAIPTEHERRSPEKARGVVRGTCKNAAAQTDLSPRLEHKPPTQPRKLNRDSMARTQSTDDSRQHGISKKNTQEAPRPTIDEEVEDWLTPAPGLSPYARHVEPDVGCQRICAEAQSYETGGDVLVARQEFEESTIPLRYIRGPGRTAIPSYSRARDVGSFLEFPVPRTEGMDCVSRHLNACGSPYQTEDQGSLPGNFGFENLDEFIKRIEGEAAMPPRQVPDVWEPYDDFEVVGHPEPRPLAVPGLANLDGADGTAVIPSEDWFALESGTLAPITTGNLAQFPREARLVGPASLSILEPYPLEEQEGGLGAAWHHRDMF